MVRSGDCVWSFSGQEHTVLAVGADGICLGICSRLSYLSFSIGGGPIQTETLSR